MSRDYTAPGHRSAICGHDVAPSVEPAALPLDRSKAYRSLVRRKGLFSRVVLVRSAIALILLLVPTLLVALAPPAPSPQQKGPK